MKTRLILLFMLLVGVTASAQAPFKLASLVSDGMVLQQQTQVRLWGTATPGQQISVVASWNSKGKVTAQADADGRWLLTLTTPEATFTPQNLTFSMGKKTVATVQNILIGEVWLAGGQSNMQMPLKGFGGCCVEGGLDEAIAAHAIDGVRMFNVPMRQAMEPQEECGGRWMTTDRFTDVMEFSATAWYFASQLRHALHVPVGIVNIAYGGTRVEGWLPRDILTHYPDVSLDPQEMAKLTDYYRPMLTYNAMFLPARRYTVKGIIWYQGCSNVGAHAQYAERLTTMVSHWRSQLALGEIPFYMVEIAPYRYNDQANTIDGALLREAQHRALATIPNSGLVSTNDLVDGYEQFNIHPRRKSEVGHRLCYMALNKSYGYREVCCEGPCYTKWEAKGNEAWVSFDHLDMGICRNYDIRGFEVAGEDKVFYPADKVWLHWQTNEVVVSSLLVDKPVAVRYGFRDFQPGTLIGGNQLPAYPFRTDDWKE